MLLSLEGILFFDSEQGNEVIAGWNSSIAALCDEVKYIYMYSMHYCHGLFHHVMCYVS